MIYGPDLLVAHRCDEHRTCAPINNAADCLVVYPTEGRPKAHPIGTGPNGERIAAECGGCLAEQVEGLYQTVLDLMDTIADQLTAHAEQRKQAALLDTFRP